MTTNTQKTQPWTFEQKKALLQEAEQSKKSIYLVAKDHSINPALLYATRRQLEKNTKKDEVKSSERSEVKVLKDRIVRLEQLLGIKTEEIETLKEYMRK